MSQQQYNNLMSTMLKEKHALAKLRAELEGRKGKLCRCYKKFGHLARNCRNRKEGEKGAEMPQNKFEILRSRVMQCGVEERIVRSTRTVVVKCFKCEEEEYKYRECPLWERKLKRVARPGRGKAHQEEKRPVRPIREKAARPVKGEAQQEEWKRSSWKEQRKRAEWYCGPTVSQDAELWKLGWRSQGTIVTYLKCLRCGEEGCHMEEN